MSTFIYQNILFVKRKMQTMKNLYFNRKVLWFWTFQLHIIFTMLPCVLTVSVSSVSRLLSSGTTSWPPWGAGPPTASSPSACRGWHRMSGASSPSHSSGRRTLHSSWWWSRRQKPEGQMDKLNILQPSTGHLMMSFIYNLSVHRPLFTCFVQCWDF